MRQRVYDRKSFKATASQAMKKNNAFTIEINSRKLNIFKLFRDLLQSLIRLLMISPMSEESRSDQKPRRIS